MKSSKTLIEMAALRDAALEDLMLTTDAQLAQEALEDGEDLDTIAAQVRSTIRDAAATALRQRMARAKERMQPSLGDQAEAFIRPPLEQIKQIVQALFQSNQSLGLAFRDGKKQTDADWLSLYDDLVAMGEITPDDHGR